MARERRIGLLMASICTILWGFLAIVMKLVSKDVDTMTIVWFRFTFAFGILAILISLRDRKRLGVIVKPPLLGLLAALLLCGNYLGYMKGLELTTPSFAQVLIQLAPLLLALVGVLWFKERMTLGQAFGALLTVSGFVLFYFDKFDSGIVEEGALQQGVMLLILASISWAAYAAFQKHLVMRGYAPQDLNLLLYGVPIVLLVPWANFETLAGLEPKMWGLMVFLGFNTLVAYGALGEALKRLPAYQVSLIITLNPLITLAAMASLRAMEVSWVPEDEVSILGYGAALLVVLGIAQVLRKAERPLASSE
ncbi:MAG: drug/metabolite transporter (DMT)-like permease [Planctomycetota bacterium]|jgi:drug/metabolite transporter (DMT)-like permease